MKKNFLKGVENFIKSFFKKGVKKFVKKKKKKIIRNVIDINAAKDAILQKNMQCSKSE